MDSPLDIPVLEEVLVHTLEIVRPLLHLELHLIYLLIRSILDLLRGLLPFLVAVAVPDAKLHLYQPHRLAGSNRARLANPLELSMVSR